MRSLSKHVRRFIIHKNYSSYFRDLKVFSDEDRVFKMISFITCCDDDACSGSFKVPILQKLQIYSHLFSNRTTGHIIFERITLFFKGSQGGRTIQEFTVTKRTAVCICLGRRSLL